LVEDAAESTYYTETDTFNDESVVYVRGKAGIRQGSSYPSVTITDDNDSVNKITITVYDDGHLPDDKYNDTYYWGKFT